MITPQNNDIFQPNKPLFEEHNLLWNVSDLYGYTVQAKDGETGKVHDFYFDNKTWAIRYLVVDLGDWVLDTGQWIPGQKVVVSTIACGQPIHETQVFPLTLFQEQVELSPTVEMYKQWQDESQFYSARAVTGNYIKALDGDMGHVEDLIVDTKTWVIAAMVVDTKNWWPAKKVLVAPLWIDQIDLTGSSVLVDLPRDFIRNSPVFEHKAFSKPEAADKLGRL